MSTKELNLRPTIGALLILALFWILLFFASQVPSSGFHYVDDHEIYTFYKDIKQTGYATTLKQTVKNDFHWRFRPLFYAVKVTQVFLFKDKAFCYYMYNLSLAILTSFFL